MDEFLKKLASQLRVSGGGVLTADEVAKWPEGKLDELIEMRVIEPVENAKGLVCDQCDQRCYIEPQHRKNPQTGEIVGVHFCRDDSEEGGLGRIQLDLKRLRQWRIVKKRLWKLVYGFESEWQVPWDVDNSDYIPLKEAVNLADNDSISVRKMSRLLEDIEFPVHHMHSAQRCKVNLQEFRHWLKFAEHGVITDAAIDKYLARTRERKKEAQQKRWAKRRSSGSE